MYDYKEHITEMVTNCCGDSFEELNEFCYNCDARSTNKIVDNGAFCERCKEETEVCEKYVCNSCKLKQDKYFKQLYKDNTIDMNDYFAYSGKEEYNNTFVSLIPFYRNKKNISINNDMSKYVLKDYNNNNNKTK